MTTNKQDGETPTTKILKPEQEHVGSIWNHPYLIYVLITFLLFLFLVFVGWLALEEGWIPTRA